METWELVARERIRDTVARYNWSGDAGRIEDLTRCFCEDGELEVRGVTTARGRAAIAEFLGGVTERDSTATNAVKRIVRHNITNIRFTDVTRERASVDSYFTVFTEVGLDHYGRYRDVFVPIGDGWLIRHRFVSTGVRPTQRWRHHPPSTATVSDADLEQKFGSQTMLAARRRVMLTSARRRGSIRANTCQSSSLDGAPAHRSAGDSTWPQLFGAVTPSRVASGWDTSAERCLLDGELDGSGDLLHVAVR